MSSSIRATSKGGKGTKADKSHKLDKTESGKSSEKQLQSVSNKNEDPSIKDKVKQLIEMTQRSEEEVCLALHECDNDLNQATNMLFETIGTGEWEKRVKKKKTRQTSISGGKQDKTDEAGGAAAEEWDESQNTGGGHVQGQQDNRSSRYKNGPPPRLHGRHNDSRGGGGGWRGRERHENDRNNGHHQHEEGGRPDFHRDRDRRGRPGGPRGGGRGSGRGGGRGGRYPPRGGRGASYNKPIDTWDSSNTWDNSTATAAATNNHVAEENWDDFPGTDEWSTEEYQGSLADSKVFTPSMAQMESTPGDAGAAQADASLAGQHLGQMGQQGMQLPSQSPVPPMVGTLTAAQTQYFSQLQQNNDALGKTYINTNQPYQNQTYEKTASVQYNAVSQYPGNVTSQFNSSPTSQYSTSQVYSSGQQFAGPNNAYPETSYQVVNSGYSGVQEQVPAQQPLRTKTQRARVPPPSKIPASAVEMPGDLNTSIGYLDVQFGAMDLIDANSSFDTSVDSKYGAPQSNSVDSVSTTPPMNLDVSTPNQSSNLDNYSPKNTTQTSINSLSQSLSSADVIPQPSDTKYAPASRTTGQGTATSTTGAGSATAAAALDLKQDAYSQPATYNTYQPKGGAYNASTYTAATTTANSFVSNQTNSYASNQASSYNAANANSYPNTYSNSTYQAANNSTVYPSITQGSSTYPSNSQSYQQNSQSVYGANAGLNNSSSYGNTSTSQYNSYNSSNKINKDSAYDSPSNTSAGSQTTTTNVTLSASSTLSQTTVSVSKTSSTTLAAKSSNSVVSNIPPGVAPVMSTPYIMGQVPYFQQPVYSYEDMQLLQQRLPPHMTTPYYDMSYQTPTTLAAVRDSALVGNVGYSLSSDGRFARTDNNASPVPSTLSQQTSTLTQGHQAQPILAGTAPPPYFFATPFNTLAPNYQFGTMYTQLPATNAHGSSNSTQYPKPTAYSSGYGSYDPLNPSQDYAKGAYVNNSQGQKGAGGNASSAASAGNDLSAMYAKSHAALGKVNSYEKQGFHSGTPPPFAGGPLHASQSGGLAPSGTGYPPQVYIPTMAPHQQHHSTHLMTQPLHQDSGNATGQRSQGSNQAKTGTKQPYQTSYWNQA